MTRVLAPEGRLQITKSDHLKPATTRRGFAPNLVGRSLTEFETEIAQFGEAKAGSVRQFEDGLITKPGRSFRSERAKELGDFIVGEGFGQAFELESTVAVETVQVIELGQRRRSDG